MDIFTMDRGFQKVQEIDAFASAIWTDRYYGDGDFELFVEPSTEMVQTLAKDTLVGLEGSDEPMMVETLDIEDGKLKVVGISLTQWLNNRFLRNTYDPATREWTVTGIKPGQLMCDIVQNWCIASVYLNNTLLLYASWPNDGAGHDYTINPNSMGMANSTIFSIPGLEIAETDTGGSNIDLQVPFGPVYDALKAIGEAYEVGMKITLDAVTDVDYTLGFHSYRGQDRTSNQIINEVIRFSPDLESLTNIKEIDSSADRVDIVYTYPTQINPYIATWNGGIPRLIRPLHYGGFIVIPSGFDLRVAMDFNDTIKPEDLSDPPIAYDVTPATWPAGDNPAIRNTTMVGLIKPGQQLYLNQHKGARLVDGEIVQTGQLNYGEDFFMGDIIEIEGYSGIRQSARVTEYIRSQDDAGERAYPSITIIE